jgi:autotransporter translocation and assembly factor TamB
VHLEGRIHGTQALTNIAGTLSAHQLKRQTVSALTINGKYALEIPDLEVRRARGTSEVEATFAEVGAFKIQRMTVKLKHDTNTLDVVTRVEQEDRTFTAEAGLLLEPDRRVVRLRQFAMEAGGVVWQLSGGDATVHHGAELMISGLTLASNAARITVEGGMPFKADVGAPGTLTATLTGVPLEDFDKIFLGTQRMKGQLNGTVNLSGSFEKPQATTDLRVTEGVAGGVSYQQLTVTAEYLDRIARLDARLQVDASTGFTVGGTIPLDGAGLDVRAQTDGLNAAILEPLLVGRLDRLGGILKMNLQLTGALRQPTVRGDAGFVNGQFRFVPTGADFRRLNAGVRFDGDRVDVDQFTIEDGDGHRLSVTGTSAGAGLGRSLDITAKSAGLHVLHNELGELALDADLKATGTLQAPDVQGVLRIARGRLEVDKLLKRFSSSAYEPVAPATPAEAKPAAEPAQPGLFSQATVDVRIDIPDNLVLRGRDLRVSARSAGLGDINMTTGGTVRAQKEAGAALTLLGQVAIVRGQYNFQGRRFDIERGSDVRWLGQATLDPVISVTATREISGLVAKVSITGTVARPEIALSSDPPLDPGDVLSLIVFNQPINELGAGEQVTLAERAGLLAAGALATPISDSVARALDLDVFEIRTGETAGAGPTITVGRQVSEQLFVGFRHEFGEEDISRVSFEYRFRKFMRVVTTWGQGTNPNRVPREETAGIDLFFVIKR